MFEGVVSAEGAEGLGHPTNKTDENVGEVKELVLKNGRIFYLYRF